MPPPHRKSKTKSKTSSKSCADTHTNIISEQGTVQEIETQKWTCVFDELVIQSLFPLSVSSVQVITGDQVNGMMEKKEEGKEKEDALVAKVNEAAFRFRVKVSEKVGRFAVAKDSYDHPGVIVLKERAFAWSVRYQFMKQICANCAEVVCVGKDMLPCELCKMSFYCGKSCKTNHLSLHDVQCNVLRACGEIVATVECDVDLVRTIVAVLSKFIQEEKCVPVCTKIFESTKSDVLLMANNSVENAHLAEKVASQIITNLKLEHANQVSVAQIVFIASIINANSHSLTRQDDPSKIWGVGLFPVSSLFNHSCYPNMQFCSEGNVLTYRLLRPVAKGEELTINYTALYQSRASRRDDLQAQKQFICRCDRCELIPRNEDQKIKFEHDSFLNALTCNRPECKGYLRECINVDGETAWVCTLDQKHLATATEAQVILNRCKVSYQESYKQYMESMQYERTAQNASRVRNCLEASMGLYKLHLHPSHELIFQAMLPLINCCGGEKDYRAKTDYTKQLIALAEAVHPQYFLPLCNYYEALVQSFQQQIDYQAAVGKAIPKSLYARYKDEMLAAMQHCVDNYKIACGEAHMVTKIAISKLENIKSKY